MMKHSTNITYRNLNVFLSPSSTSNLSNDNSSGYTTDLTQLADPFSYNPVHLQQVMYLLFLVIPLHISHIVSILLKRSLRQNIYYILLNLCLSDLLLIITILLRVELEGIVLSTAYSITYAASILFTLAITMDRYMKVQYALRYQDICRPSRLFVALIFIWGFSLLGVGGLLLAIDPNIQTIILRVFSILCALALVACSSWVKHVRNRHLSNITQLNVYFGVHGENYHLLKNMKNAVQEIIQLNFVTAVLIVCGSALHILGYFLKNASLDRARMLVNGIYFVSNPVLYGLVMSELRRHYCCCLRLIFNKLRNRFFNRNQIHPSSMV